MNRIIDVNSPISADMMSAAAIYEKHQLYIGWTESVTIFFSVLIINSPGGGGGGRSLPYLRVLGMCPWTGCLFELPALAQGVFFWAFKIGTGCFFEVPNIKYIGSNYTINQSIKFSVIFKIGTGCLFSRVANCDRVCAGFEHAGVTPLPIHKASNPPPPRELIVSCTCITCTKLFNYTLHTMFMY